MDLLERYEILLTQALAELGPVERSTATKRAAQIQVALAPGLGDVHRSPRQGDVIYRLSIEHDLPYNALRETIISLMTGVRPALAGRRPESGLPRAFAPKLEAHHSLILLALEVMPPDSLL